MKRKKNKEKVVSQYMCETGRKGVYAAQPLPNGGFNS